VKRWQKVAAGVVGSLLVILFAELMVVSRSQAQALVTHPNRRAPGDRGPERLLFIG